MADPPPDERDLATVETVVAQREPSASDRLAVAETLSLLGGAPPVGDPSPGASTRLDDIVLLSTIAEGGMGRVMLARQRTLHRDVAVKMLKDADGQATGVLALLNEAVLSGSLEHPNIVPIHMLGVGADGLPLLVMKRVEGVSWAELVDDPQHDAWGRMPGGDADKLLAHLSIFVSVCNALHFAHSRGVVHCDVKPHNVMVGAFGEVYLVDWGIAVRRDRTEGQAAHAPRASISGTPGFMAPEQTMTGTGDCDERTDVYLLGATLHYVLTGTPRHGSGSLMSALLAAWASEPVAYGRDVPEELAAICNRATAREPERRFATAEALRDAVSGYLRHRGAIALADTASDRLEHLQAMLAAAHDAASPAGLRDVHELMTECHFGFRQSLSAWPENPTARSRFEACLDAMVRFELRHENVARAQALLSEMSAPPADLSGALDDASARVGERRSREARLLSLEREQNWTVSAGQRAAFLTVTLVVSTVLWRIAVRDQGAHPHAIPPATQAAFLGVALAILSALVVRLRRSLLATTVSRGVVLGTLVCVATMFLNRALHVVPAPTTADLMSVDQLMAALTAALSAIVLARWLWLPVIPLLVGAFAARAWPTSAGSIFATTALISFAITMFWLSRSSRPGSAPRA